MRAVSPGSSCRTRLKVRISEETRCELESRCGRRVNKMVDRLLNTPAPLPSKVKSFCFKEELPKWVSKLSSCWTWKVFFVVNKQLDKNVMNKLYAGCPLCYGKHPITVSSSLLGNLLNTAGQIFSGGNIIWGHFYTVQQCLYVPTSDYYRWGNALKYVRPRPVAKITKSLLITVHFDIHIRGSVFWSSAGIRKPHNFC